LYVSSYPFVIFTDTSVVFSPAKVRAIVQALTLALQDYTTDQRGDVGSWIRQASLLALGRVLVHLTSHGKDEAREVIDQETFARVLEGVVKQGVERLEPVREEAGALLRGLRDCGAGKVWEWEGESAMVWDQR
jgi:hypothetical protein